MSDSERPRSLENIQQWMQAVITHPEGVVPGLRSAAAREAMDVAPEDLHRIVPPSKSLKSAERLGIYANAYHARLLECLGEEFPALRHAVGEKAFGAFVVGYLERHPSESYTLAELGRRFPQFLEDTRPGDDEPRPNWTDFVIELAKVERTYAEVFDGPGMEQSRGMLPNELAAIPPERWPEARLVPVPCLRLLELTHPVHEYITAVRKRLRPATPAPSPTWLIVMRREYIVRRVAVARDEFELLAALVHGATVGEAIDVAQAQPGVDAEALAQRLHAWFRDWTAAGYFSAIALP
jgi:hypothetical protein